MGEAREIARLLKNVAQGAWSGSDVTGTVEKSENGAVYVRFDGASELTPVESAMAASVGDSVTVRVVDGRAVLTGNLTHPATDDGTAFYAAGVAQEAQQIAEAVNQHFWDDTNGAHVTDVTQDEWTAAAAAGFPDLSDSKPYHNALWNSLGMLFRRALYNLVSISRSAIAFYDGLGNNQGNIVASFGSDGARIGKAAGAHVDIDSQYVKVKSGTSEFVSLGPWQYSSGAPTGGGIVRFAGNENQYVRGDSHGDTVVNADDAVSLVSGIDSEAAVGEYMSSRLMVRKPENSVGAETALQLYSTKKTGASSSTESIVFDVDFNGDVSCGKVNGISLISLIPKQYNIASLVSQTTEQAGNFDVTSALLEVSGYVAQLRVNFKASAALTAGTEYVVGTLGSGVRPALGAQAGVGARRVFATFNTSGQMVIRPAVNISASSTTSYAFNATYILASAYSG